MTVETPPVFLLHTGDDTGVPVENSLLFFRALKEKGVPAEMHIFPRGGHGFGLALEEGKPTGWPVLLEGWLYMWLQGPRGN